MQEVKEKKSRPKNAGGRLRVVGRMVILMTLTLALLLLPEVWASTQAEINSMRSQLTIGIAPSPTYLPVLKADVISGLGMVSVMRKESSEFEKNDYVLKYHTSDWIKLKELSCSRKSLCYVNRHWNKVEARLETYQGSSPIAGTRAENRFI